MGAFYFRLNNCSITAINLIIVSFCLIIFFLDIDQLITITGMVTRTSSLIPEMRQGYFECTVCKNAVSFSAIFNYAFFKHPHLLRSKMRWIADVLKSRLCARIAILLTASSLFTTAPFSWINKSSNCKNRLVCNIFRWALWTFIVEIYHNLIIIIDLQLYAYNDMLYHLILYLT